MGTEEYILEHKDDDVRSLALKKMPEGVNHTWVLRQIEGYQLAKKKLPEWAERLEDGIWFPPRLSMEQCSSEETAKYKASIVRRLTDEHQKNSSNDGKGTLTDLNGGFGVDFSYMAKEVDEAIYVEQNEELCEIARHNFPLLGLPHARIYNKRCEDFLSPTPPSFLSHSHSFPLTPPIIAFLDPARRDTQGRKVVTIEDCTPDITILQETLMRKADYVIVKLSPMLDITAALRKVNGVQEVHVVSVKGECKELLLVMRKGVESGDGSKKTEIHCVNLDTEDEDFVCSMMQTPSYFMQYAEIFNRTENKTETYLLEPNASIMKAGVQNEFGLHYRLKKLHPMSNLFVGEEKIDRVPARQFRIVGMSDFSKSGLKALLQGMSKANITVRNFPSDVATLRKRLKIKEGGSDYLFATTLYDGSHALLHCVKA